MGQVDEGIAQVLIHLDPELDYGPNWTPEPDPPVHFPGIGARAHWGDVFDWIKSGYNKVFFGGTPIDTITTAQMQQAIDTAVGQVVKAFSGFIDQGAAMTVQAASLLEDAITNTSNVETFDFSTLSQRIDGIEATLNFMTQYVVPDLEAKITHAEAFAYATALAAQQNAEAWARENIFDPVYTELLKVQPAIDASIKANNPTIVAAAQSQVNALHDLLTPTITAAAAAAASATNWIDDCGEPMCQTQGPKTDLGKFLKALKVAEWAALIAELAALRADGLDGLLSDVEGWAKTAISDFESTFFTGGGTLGDTITSI